VDRANAAIEKTRELRRQVPIMVNSTGVKAIDRGELTVRILVASSIERMLDYITNIGELTINLSHADSGVDGE